MKTKVPVGFPICMTNACMEHETSEMFHIVDDNTTGKSQIKAAGTVTEYPYFTVENPTKKEVTFLAIDGCIFCTPQDGKRCDCAVFDDIELHFVELKRGGPGIIPASEKKNKAIEQLEATLIAFKNSIDLTSHKLKAHICVGYFSAAPSTKSSDLPNILHFLNNYGADLMEGNGIRF